MATIKRLVKGSPLTAAEHDANMTRVDQSHQVIPQFYATQQALETAYPAAALPNFVKAYKTNGDGAYWMTINNQWIYFDNFNSAALGSAAYEDNDQFVQTTGNQTIGGVKSFTDNVGIGTTSPTAKLHVANGTLRTWAPVSGTSAIFESTANNRNFVTLTAANEAEIWFGNAALQSKGRVRYEMVNDNMEFWTSSTQKMVIDGNGNVGIGTTSPTAKLDVNGNTKITGTLDLNDGSNRTIIGTQAGGSGSDQSAFGYLAGEANISASQSAFGRSAGRNNAGANQAAFGYAAGATNTGANQSAFGYTAGLNNTGANQSAFGYDAGRGNSGSNNIAIGFESSENNTGDNVLSIGYRAAKGNTQNNRTIINNDLLPAFASYSLAESAFGTGQSGMTYLYFNTTTNAVEGVRF